MRSADHSFIRHTIAGTLSSLTLCLQQEDLCQLLVKGKNPCCKNPSDPSVNDNMNAIGWFSGNAYRDKLQFMRFFLFELITAGFAAALDVRSHILQEVNKRLFRWQ